ncbi:hypothetical protein N9Z55_04935, partial [Akkermansiaceae bacterium]|nr:hypothetical protein [Akkermansiaceae bacterium]
EAFLFNGTVRENLSLADRHANDDAIWKALEAAKASEFVRALPKQLDTNVGERGVKLSGGEGNTFQATIVAVDNDWNFVVIGAGEKSGLTGDSKLLIQRDGRLLGRLLISKLEPNTAVADVEPGSLRNGVALQAGDQVILESVSSN